MIPKFRAWLMSEKKMVCVEGLEFVDGKLYNIRCKVDGLMHFYPARDVLMQSTGVLDDNGVEIFEDDIVIAEGKRGFVMWENGGFQVTIYDGLGYHIDEYQSLLKIGNTFENPELLEEVSK